jgi:glucokinase
MAADVFVGVDLGGTSLLVLATNAKGKILNRRKQKTRVEQGADAIIARIADSVRKTVSGAGAKMKHVRAVGVGSPGPLDPSRGVILHAPNLGPTWNNTPIADRLSNDLGCPVHLENDVNVGAVGEHALGAGQGADSLVAIFVGTGIGGGMILDGKLYQGSRFAAAEVGHAILLAGGPECGCGRQGCAEALASRTAIEREIRAGIAACRDSLIPEIMEELGRQDMSSNVIATALERGDALTQEVMSKAQYYLGLLVASVVNIVDPQVVVLGGGIVERLGAAFVEPVRRTAEKHYLNQQEGVHIAETQLKGDAGALGAAILAKGYWQQARKKRR